ncbi:rhodanese-like domain-containing protein [Thiobacter aerophilum]|uniref:Rhodanese-like domain-containing protein n=1 Tax=Thiobacter aerophilum TaxID=3121275 RepID=A0ABV0EF44_9BURK
MEHLTPAELAAWLSDPSRPKPRLVDVREPWEFDICHLPGAELFPMRQLLERLDALSPDRETVVICHHGIRSYQVARVLERQGFRAVYNLTGGLAAWARDVDASMPTY